MAKETRKTYRVTLQTNMDVIVADVIGTKTQVCKYMAKQFAEYIDTDETLDFECFLNRSSSDAPEDSFGLALYAEFDEEYNLTVDYVEIYAEEHEYELLCLDENGDVIGGKPE